MPESLSVLLYHFPLSKKNTKPPKNYSLPFLIFKAPSPLPTWGKHSSPARPPTTWSCLSPFWPKQVLPQSFCTSLSKAFLPPRKLWDTTVAEIQNRRMLQPHWAVLYHSPTGQKCSRAFSVSSFFREVRGRQSPFPPGHPMTPSQLDLTGLSGFPADADQLEGQLLTYGRPHEANPSCRAGQPARSQQHQF